MANERANERASERDSGGAGQDSALERAIRTLQDGSGDEESFRVVFDAYYRKVNRLFERKGVPPEDRPDLIQKTFMRIYKGVGGLQNRARFQAFLRTTAQRVFLRWLERGKTNKETLGGRTRVSPDEPEILDFLVSDEPWPIPLRRPPSPERELVDKNFMESVARVIDGMPPAMSRIARLRFIDGLLNKEIAEVLRKKPGDVGYQLHQARKRLADAL